MFSMLNIFNYLPVLKSHKNPLTACIYSTFLGSVGLGIYLKSFEDFFIGTLIILAFAFFTVGLGLVPGCILTGIYGYFRVVNSNNRLNKR